MPRSDPTGHLPTNELGRDEILQAVDLGELLESLSGIDRRGHQYPCPSPSHEQTGKTPPVTLDDRGHGYQVWHCHACGAGGTAIDALMAADGIPPGDALQELGRRTHAPTQPTARGNDSRPTARPSGPALPESALGQAIPPDVADRLYEIRGWRRETISRLGLGFEERSQRVTFPVRDERGQLAGIPRYQPDAARRKTKDKMLSVLGSQRLPFPRPEDVPGHILYVCEGEPDAVALHSLGLPAVALPGTGKRDPAWWPRLARGRQRIVVITDSDGAGRQFAQAVSTAMAAHCDEVKVLDLEPNREDGYDVTDLLLEALKTSGEHGYQEVRALLEAAAEQAETTPHQEPPSARAAHDCATFFDKKTFVPPRLGEELRARFPTATGGRRLYAFQDGIYRPAAEALRREIVTALGNRWRARHADEVIAYLTQSSRSLWGDPPLDRVAVRNGILRPATRQLVEASPEFLSPVQISAIYDPAATSPAIDRFLEQVIPEGIELLHEVIGHLMVPENRQRAFMFLGPGGNGKSTVLRLVRAFLGADNVSSVSLHDLEENRFATADLFGKLVNLYADLDARALSSTGIFKSITGGDPIRGERKNRDPFTFVAYARLVFSANEPPPTSDSSHAFFDRWIILPFLQRLRGSTQERDQDDLIRELTTPAELSGLLNHAVAGLERLRRNRRFTETDTVRAASTEFRRSADSVAAFLAEESRSRPGARVARSQLWTAYGHWCTENNRGRLSAQRFHRRVRELHSEVSEVKVQGIRTYDGLELDQP